MFGRAVLLFRTCLHPARPEMNINNLILQAIIMSFFPGQQWPVDIEISESSRPLLK